MDEAIKTAYENRSRFQLNDSAAYYFNALDRIMRPDYKVTVEDILKSRVRTSGIVEEQYDINGVRFVYVRARAAACLCRCWLPARVRRIALTSPRCAQHV